MPGTVQVLCTGAAGYIGHFLIKALQERGYDVWCLLGPGDDPRGLEGRDFHLVRGDITRPESLAPLERPFDYVYHLAGCLSSLDAQRLFQVNVQGTANIVQTILKSGVRPKRFLFTSSIAAVGPSGWHCPHTEDSCCHPVSAYGRSKVQVEQYLRSLAPSLPVTIVRLPMVYGPGLVGRGIFVFFKIINRRIRFDLGEMEVTLGFAEDIVRGMIMAAESPKACGQTYFLGEAKVYRASELLRCIEEAIGKKALRIPVPLNLIEAIFGGLIAVAPGQNQKKKLRDKIDELETFMKYRSWAACVDKARKELGFEVETPFPEGARRMARWYVRNGYL